VTASSVVTLLALAISVPATAATFFNGSFESPGAPSIPWSPGVRYLANESLDGSGSGWIHVGASDPQGFFGDFYTNGDGTDWSLVPQDQSYYIGFGATGATGGILEQTFDTEIGLTYVVNYWLSTQELEVGPFPDQVAFVGAYDGTTELASRVNILNAAPGWNLGLALHFVATSSSTTMRFIDQSLAGTSDASLGPNDTYRTNWGLDNVTVAQTPEPASCVLLGLGISVLALRPKKRK
jgi:hypothetical protein